MGISNFLAWVNFFKEIDDKYFSENNVHLPDTCYRTFINSNNKNKNNDDYYSNKSMIKANDLIFMIDFTYLLVSCYNSSLSGRNFRGMVKYFEKCVVSRLVSCLYNISDNCFICGNKGKSFGEWKFGQFAGDDTQYCKCCTSLSLKDFFSSLKLKDKYMKENNIRLKFCFLYDSRNFNPMARYITSSGRYKEQENVQLSTLKDFIQSTPEIKKSGFNENEALVEDWKFCPTKSKKDRDGEELFSIGKDYFKHRYRLVITEMCLFSFISNLFSEDILGVSNCVDTYNKFKINDDDEDNVVPDLNQNSTGFSIIMDSVPDRVIKLLHSKSITKYSFSNDTFIDAFYLFYHGSVGNYNNSIKNQLIRNFEKHVKNAEYIISDNSTNSKYEDNACFYYSSNCNNNSTSMNNFGSNRGTYYIYRQSNGPTCMVGESDIKMLPYITLFLTDKHKTLYPTRRVWVDSEDSDYIAILLMYFRNSSMKNKIGRFYVENSEILSHENCSYIVDMGVKKVNTYKKRKQEFDNTVKSSGSSYTQKNTSNSSNSNNNGDDMEVDVDPLWDNDIGMVEDVTKSGVLPYGDENEEFFDNKSNKKKTSNPRFVDVMGLYHTLVVYLSKYNCHIEDLLLFMILSGGDYTENPPGIGAVNMIKAFEYYLKINKTHGHYPGKEHDLSPVFSKKNDPKKLTDQNYWYPSDSREGEIPCVIYISTTPKKPIPLIKQVDALLVQTKKNVDYHEIYELIKTKTIESQLKKKPTKFKMLSYEHMLYNTKRAFWVLNYYMGCEGISTMCCDQVDVSHIAGSGPSMWGWMIVPRDSSGGSVITKSELKIWSIRSNPGIDPKVLLENDVKNDNKNNKNESNGTNMDYYGFTVTFLLNNNTKDSKIIKDPNNWKVVMDNSM